jgi:hypothetical protein
MRHDQRPGHLLQEVSRGAAQEHLAQARVTIGAHDQGLAAPVGGEVDEDVSLAALGAG